MFSLVSVLESVSDTDMSLTHSFVQLGLVVVFRLDDLGYRLPLALWRFDWPFNGRPYTIFEANGGDGS